MGLENYRFLAAVEPIDESVDRAYCEGAEIPNKRRYSE
jgi:hypothetical protein